MLRAQLFGNALAALSCFWLAGCAGSFAGGGAFSPLDSAPTFRDANMSMQGARDAVVTGTATKADVLAALGSGNVVKFDSGFEVWVYRDRSTNTDSDKAEFVVLFTPSGIVKKTRIRPASGTTR